MSISALPACPCRTCRRREPVAPSTRLGATLRRRSRNEPGSGKDAAEPQPEPDGAPGSHVARQVGLLRAPATILPGGTSSGRSSGHSTTPVAAACASSIGARDDGPGGGPRGSRRPRHSGINARRAHGRSCHRRCLLHRPGERGAKLSKWSIIKEMVRSSVVCYFFFSERELRLRYFWMSSSFLLTSLLPRLSLGHSHRGLQLWRGCDCAASVAGFLLSHLWSIHNADSPWDLLTGVIGRAQLFPGSHDATADAVSLCLSAKRVSVSLPASDSFTPDGGWKRKQSRRGNIAVGWMDRWMDKVAHSHRFITSGKLR